MKILLINKFHYIQGGADRHYLELANLLKRNGHEVVFFSMNSIKNTPCKQSKYFVDNLDFSKIKINRHLFKIIGRMFWSREAQRKLEQLIKEEKPDIAHLHNIYHQISPSIITTLKNNNIPIVMTVHDYYLVSPLYSLYANNKIYNPGYWNYWHIILTRAIKNSLAASILSSIVNWWHRYKGYYAKVDLFISPSNFLAKHLRRVYLNSRIEVLPNFTESHESIESVSKDYYLYAGRIINEKGVELILQAAIELPNVKFKIAGSGPDEFKLKDEYNLDNVKWLGQLETKKLDILIKESKAVIIPSRWYENCPLAILESFSLGVPVIASNIGGIPELVQDGYNGLLFKNDNIQSLIEQISKINNSDELRQHLAMNAKEAAKKYTLDTYYMQLMKLYESI